ncbi:hypothetical protein RRG08_067175, partial [Elysia crispata]
HGGLFLESSGYHADSIGAGPSDKITSSPETNRKTFFNTFPAHRSYQSEPHQG